MKLIIKDNYEAMSEWAAQHIAENFHTVFYYVRVGCEIFVEIAVFEAEDLKKTELFKHVHIDSGLILSLVMRDLRCFIGENKAEVVKFFIHFILAFVSHTFRKF